MSAPLAIALPDGLNVSGVTTWALRLAGALARRGRPVCLLVHREPDAQRRLDAALDPRVGVVRLDHLPRFEDAPGLDGRIIAAYAAALRDLADRHGGPVVLSPNLKGDCYGVAAALCLVEPGPIRVVGWQHADQAYDARVLAHYEPVIARFVGVSDRLAASLRGALPGRAADIASIPHGIEAPDRLPGRAPLPGRPVRLVYTGRLEHAQKRVLALVHLSDELSRLGVAHELTIAGDGPARAELDALAASRPSIRRVAPVPPDRVPALLDRHDAFVLASRYEGLSVSLLEAMSRGCVPIVTRVASGTDQLVAPGECGFIADADPDADEARAGRALADAVRSFLSGDAVARSTAAWERVRQCFSLDRHAERVGALVDAAAASPARAWPAERACAFTGAGAPAPGDAGVRGTVPADAHRRLSECLARLAGRRVAIFGVGAHTLALAPVLARSPAVIAGFLDDDRGTWGTRLWNWPVVAPADASRLEATDAVISSWLHEGEIWSRRGVLESQGLRVHRLYADATSPRVTTAPAPAPSTRG